MRHATLALAALLAALLLPRSAGADGSKLGPDYILGPDDVIEITVPNFTDLNKTLTVLTDGKIAFPGVGEIVAAGKTPKALADEITKKLLETYNNIQVYVSVQQAHSQRVRIMGPVKLSVPMPGTIDPRVGQSAPLAYDLKPGMRLLDLIATAGGLTAKPRMVTGKIVRTSGPVVVLDIPKAIATPDGPANVALQADDLVMLEEKDAATNMVMVQGEVARPGPVDLQDGLTVLQLLSAAGDVKESAALSKAYIQRGMQKIPLDLYATIRQGKANPEVVNFALKPGDILFVPQIDEKFVVLGCVAKPGQYPFQEGQPNDVVAAYSAAGGKTPEGDAGKAGLLRRTPDGKFALTPVNLDDILKKAQMAKNVPLQSGDVLFIPQRKRGLQMQDIFSGAAALFYLGLKPL